MSDYEPTNEIEPPTSSSSQTPLVSLRKAIDLGEYDPDYLATFAEWHKLAKHSQFQLIKEALNNRDRQLIQQWAEINNIIDLRLKPHLKEALDNIWKQRQKVRDDRERIYLEYSKL